MTAINQHRDDCELKKGHQICHCICLLFELQNKKSLQENQEWTLKLSTDLGELRGKLKLAGEIFKQVIEIPHFRDCVCPDRSCIHCRIQAIDVAIRSERRKNGL